MLENPRDRGLRRLCDGAAVAGHSERQLLDRFVAARDEVAFEAIVVRHGPMVVRVCRSVLTDPSDVEDAFQATFLVLVRKAGSLRDRDGLSPWLHGVARRVALQARAAAAQRQARAPLGAASEVAGLDSALRQVEDRELAMLLHAEIDHLSTAERSAVLLCDLEGLTHQEAADQLGWPLGTVKTRVARGRDRLRSRLVRRGVTLSTGAIAATLATDASAAILAAGLVAATTRAAIALAAGRALTAGLGAGPVFSLTPGGVRTMIITQWKVGALVLAAASSIVAVPVLVARQGQPPAQAKQANATRTPTVPPPQLENVPASRTTSATPSLPVGDAANPSLLQTLESIVTKIAEHDRRVTPVPGMVLVRWNERLLNARLAAATTRADTIHAFENSLTQLEQALVDRTRYSSSRLFTKEGDDPAGWTNNMDEVDTLNQRIDSTRQQLIALRAEPVDPQPTAAGGFQQQPRSGPPRARSFVRTLPADTPRQQAIMNKLDALIALKFPNDTPLETVFQSISTSTQDEAAGLPTGIPIYADPRELQDAEKTLASTVAIDLEGVPLRNSLRLLLRQVGLTYVVEGGLLLIVDLRDDEGWRNPRRNFVSLPHQPADEKRNEAIRAKLEERISVNFPNDTPLSDVVQYFRQCTQDKAAGLALGIPIYVDPLGLQAANASLKKTIRINLEGIPLRTTLNLILNQNGLTYVVEGGMIVVVAIEQAEPPAQSAPLVAPLVPPIPGGGMR